MTRFACAKTIANGCPAIAALVVVLGACTGKTGTISVSLTTAPGSTLLDSVQTLRLTVTGSSRSARPASRSS